MSRHLFINERVAGEAVPEGLHRYELRGADYDPGYPLTIEKQVMVNHAATILTAVPLSLPEQGYFRLGDELNFTGEMVTLAEYQGKNECHRPEHRTGKNGKCHRTGK